MIVRWGVRRTVVVTSCLIVLCALTTGALVLRTQLRVGLEQAIADQTLSKANGIAQIVATGDYEPLLASNDRTPAFVQVIDTANRVVASSANVANLTVPFSNLRPRLGAVVRRSNGLSIDSGEPVVVAAVPVTSREASFVVLAATPLDITRAADQKALRLLLLVFPSLFAAAGATVWFAARRALRPVDAIQAEMASITASDLSRRVSVPGSNDEIARLATTMNDTLERLQKSASRQRRFVSDVSHELRSPLASMRNQLEASLLDPDGTDWPGFVHDMQIDQARLERMVTDLLLLARHDEGERSLLEPIDLGHLVRSELARRPVPVAQHRTVACDNVLIAGHEGGLLRIVRNLVDNAERHARSIVRIEVSTQNAEAVLRVINDGASLPPADRLRIFDRFVRLDEARSSDAGGSGLGLAIVAEIVADHQGTIVVDDHVDGIAFVVRFPTLST
jgi:signal transduction histidine kinase